MRHRSLPLAISEVARGRPASLSAPTTDSPVADREKDHPLPSILYQLSGRKAKPPLDPPAPHG
jgi:hypothetical protein